MMRADLYADIYTKEDTYWWHVGKRLLVQAVISRYFKPATPDSTLVRVLDVGCGAGRVLQMLTEYGQVYGTDLSSLALEFCRKRGFNGVCQADIIEGLPFPVETFDLITALDVVEHLQDDAAGLRNLWQALKPGGLLIVSVPAYQFMFSYWDEMLGHHRRYTRRNLLPRLEQAGFVVEKSSYTNTATLLPAVAFRLVKSIWLRVRPNKTSATLTHQAVNEAETDFVDLPGLLNRLLIMVYKLEAALVRVTSLPFGLAVLAVACKPLAQPVTSRYSGSDIGGEVLRPQKIEA